MIPKPGRLSISDPPGIHQKFALRAALCSSNSSCVLGPRHALLPLQSQSAQRIQTALRLWNQHDPNIYSTEKVCRRQMREQKWLNILRKLHETKITHSIAGCFTDLRAMTLCLSFVPLYKAEMSKTGIDCAKACADEFQCKKNAAWMVRNWYESTGLDVWSSWPVNVSFIAILSWFFVFPIPECLAFVDIIFSMLLTSVGSPNFVCWPFTVYKPGSRIQTIQSAAGSAYCICDAKIQKALVPCANRIISIFLSLKGNNFPSDSWMAFQSKLRLIVNGQFASPIHHLSHPGLLIEWSRPWHFPEILAPRTSDVAAAAGCNCSPETHLLCNGGTLPPCHNLEQRKPDFWQYLRKLQFNLRIDIYAQKESHEAAVRFFFKDARIPTIKEMRPGSRCPGLGFGTRCTTCFKPFEI